MFRFPYVPRIERESYFTRMRSGALVNISAGMDSAVRNVEMHLQQSAARLHRRHFAAHSAHLTAWDS